MKKKKKFKKNILEICKQLKILRKKHGLTQRQLAKMTDIKQQVISRIENGQNVSLITFFRILYALDKGYKSRKNKDEEEMKWVLMI